MKKSDPRIRHDVLSKALCKPVGSPHQFQLVTDELGISVFKCLKCKHIEHRGELKEELLHPDGTERFLGLLDKAIKYDPTKD